MSGRGPGPESGRVTEGDAVLLSAYLDGELNADERAALEARLEREPRLRQELDALRTGGKWLRAADEAEGPPAPARLAAVSKALSAGKALEELPVAPALKPSKLRRTVLVAAGVFLGLIALTVVLAVLQILGLPTPCGWRVTPASGKVAIQRGERIVLALDAQGLMVGDRIHLDAQETATLDGPAGLHAQLSGPAVARFEPLGAVFLEAGRMNVMGPDAASALALRLNTPDGVVLPERTGAFVFEIEVQPALKK